MKIFVTGATGFIGGSVAQHLIANGHVVRGLVRDSSKIDALRASGIEPVIGDLDNEDLLEEEARAADAVINAASSDHVKSVETILASMRGSGKPFLHTSGSSVIGDDARGNVLSPRIFEETTPFIIEPSKQARHNLDNAILAAARDRIRSIVLCNTMIYGVGKGLHKESVQIPPLVKQAKDSGTVCILGRGVNRWSNVHIDDVACLYALALDKAPPGAFYFVENGECSYAEIGAAIAQRLALGEVRSWSFDRAAQEWGVGSARFSYGCNSRVRAVRAKRELNWRPDGVGLIEWIGREMPV